MAVTLKDLQRALRVKIDELRQRDELIDDLERDIGVKDATIKKLNKELETCKSMLRKAQLVPNSSTEKPADTSKERTKRWAISAESSGHINSQQLDNNIKRVSKPQQ